MTKHIVIALALALVGCSGPLPKGVFGEVSPAEGTVTLDHQGKAPQATTVTFRNDGTNDITITNLSYKMVGQPSQPVEGTLSVTAGDDVARALCVVGPEPADETLDSLTFTVEGKTEKLTVLAAQRALELP